MAIPRLTQADTSLATTNEKNEPILIEDENLRRLFSWRSRVYAPFDERGFVRFNVPKSLCEPASVKIDHHIVSIVSIFSATFATLSISASMAAYHTSIQAILTEVKGVNNTRNNVMLSWALIRQGIQDYANALGLHVDKTAKQSNLIISPMHIWSLCEAARAFLTCIDPNNDLPIYTDIAKTIIGITEADNLWIHEHYSPYLLGVGQARF